MTTPSTVMGAFQTVACPSISREPPLTCALDTTAVADAGEATRRTGVATTAAATSVRVSADRDLRDMVGLSGRRNRCVRTAMLGLAGCSPLRDLGRTTR